MFLPVWCCSLLLFLFVVYFTNVMATNNETEGERVLPVFAINNELPGFDQKQFSTSEICAAAERVTGYNSLEGAQRIGGLWRIYPRQKEARLKLLTQGFALRGIQVSVKDKNPFVVRAPNSGDDDGRDENPPSTKLIIGNVPLSFSDTELLQSVKQLGVTIFSRLISERDRDENGKLTHWKTGRRFVYIQVPDAPLPTNVNIGPFKASLYHREQKTAQRQKEAECRRCLQKGHRTVDCTQPIKCRQCLNDGHKAGDAVCALTVQGGSKNKSQQAEQTLTTADMTQNEHTDSSCNSRQTTFQQTTESDNQNKRSTDDKTSSRSRHKTRQTTLKPYKRAESGSVKRPRSRGSLPSPADKQPRMTQGDNDQEVETDNDSLYCEPTDSME